MRSDNPFWTNKLSKTAPLEVLENTPGLEGPFERAVWALETPFLLPKSHTSKEPENLFDSIVEGKPLVDSPHCQALVFFFRKEFQTAKEIMENAPTDPNTSYNLVLCLEALGKKETPMQFWQEKLRRDDLNWLTRLAIYEHLRSNYARHETVRDDILAHFPGAKPDVMLLILSHLTLHRDFDFANDLWVKGAILHEELEGYGVNLALHTGDLSLAISRAKNLSDPKEQLDYVKDFIKLVALKALEDNDFPAALEMTETLLKEFGESLTDKDRLFYLRLKCSCSLEVLKTEVHVNGLTKDSKQQLKAALSEIKGELCDNERPEIKALALKLEEEEAGPEDAYLDYLKELLALLTA